MKHVRNFVAGLGPRKFSWTNDQPLPLPIVHKNWPNCLAFYFFYSAFVFVLVFVVVGRKENHLKINWNWKKRAEDFWLPARLKRNQRGPSGCGAFPLSALRNSVSDAISNSTSERIKPQQEMKYPPVSLRRELSLSKIQSRYDVQ